MPIRLSGINSGMDTDSMVQELVKASSVKKDNLVKDKTKLQWQQDAWKNLNTKVYSFFNKYLDTMKYTNAYNKKTTTVTDTSIASVVANDVAVNGSQSMAVKQLAKSAYMTGGKIDVGMTAKAGTTLREMGLVSGAEKSSLTITVDGKATDIEMTGDMTLEQLAAKMSQAGVVANFDATNQRFFMSAKKSGEAGNFEITAKDAQGERILSSLGFSGKAATDAETVEWAGMKPSAGATAEEIMAGAAFQSKVSAEHDRRIANIQNGRNEVQTKYDELKNTDSYKAAIGTEGDTLEDKIKNLENEYAEMNKDGTLTDADKKVYEDGIKSLKDAQAYETGLASYDKLLTDENKTDIRASIEKEYVSKVNAAYRATQVPSGDKVPVKIDGQDAKIILNGAEFTSSSNTFNINGLTITAQSVSKTDDKGALIETTISTADDVDGIYNMIKDFLKEYNALIKEMDSLYNASAAKGFEPLTTEEKSAMSDKEVEEWEKKIKDSLMRRDENLGSVSNMMRTSMMAGVEIDGKRVSLADFGIEPPSYFSAGANERNMYHIAGDKDDPVSSGQKDKLRTAIASDPEGLKKFFTEFTRGMYDTMNESMKSVKNTRSMYHIYDDKRMEKEYKDYETEIKEQEDRLKRLEDKYYKQFAAMEKAMSQMNSQQSALSSLLGQ